MVTAEAPLHVIVKLSRRYSGDCSSVFSASDRQCAVLGGNSCRAASRIEDRQCLTKQCKLVCGSSAM